MKVPLVYPKIPENSNKFFKNCIAFEKYDGTNLHWCWNKFDGWNSFGTRRTQFKFDKSGIEEFNQEHAELVNAPQLFNDNLRDKLSIFLTGYPKYRDYNITVFTEFYGPNSFAGAHSEEDQINNSQKLIIIDVSVSNKILDPEILSWEFDRFPIAEVVYTGKYSGQFAEDVRKGKYKVNEGVVCKGMVDGELFMTKIKTKDYLKRLEKR